MNPALLALFVAVPLIAAGLTTIVRATALQRVILLAVPAATTVAGALLLAGHATTPVLAHSVGSFVPGVAIVLASDALSALLLTVTGALTAVCSAYLVMTGEDRYRFVVPLVLLLHTGVNGALLTGDLFNLFVFVEVMLLPSYALLSVTGTWRRLGVGRLFVLVNLVASTLLVMGVGLVYGAAGHVNLALLAGAGRADARVALGGGVILFAMLVKAGVVPVHGWLPRAYPATSAGIMGLFSALHTKIGLYAVYRVFATLYGEVPPWMPALVAVVLVTILVGSLATFGEKRLRGALAYQMVAGVGQILIGVVVFTQASLTAGLFYLVHHMLTMGGLILAVGAIESTYGSGRLDRLSGLLRREPATAAVVAVGFASLVGLPPTSGLWGKVALLGSAAGAPAPVSGLLIAAVAVASVVSLMALQRVWAEVFWGPPLKEYLPDDPTTARGPRTAVDDDVRIPARLLWPGALLIGASVALFVAAGVAWPLFDGAGAALLDVGSYVEAVTR